MSKSEESLRQLLFQADELSYSEAKDALLEEILRHAEAGEHTQLAFDTRLRMVAAYTHGMQPAKLFVPFARCLADYDSNPAAHEPWVAGTLRWQFKFAIGAMTRFPEVPLDRVTAALDQMESRYRAEGQTLNAVYNYRHRVAAHIGDLAAADHWYELWCLTPRDDNSDCGGCDPSGKADHLVDRGRDAEAVALAEPVIRGELGCVDQPQRILTTLLLPFLRTGQLEQARNAHRRAYRILRSMPQDLAYIGRHLEFCGLSGNHSRGLELLDRHLGWLDRAPDPSEAMRFAAGAAVLLRTVIDAGHGDATIRRPAHADRPAAELTAQVLHDELTRQALDIAARFDRRNGTDHQSTELRARLDRAPIVEHLSLSAAPQHRVQPSLPAPVPEFDVAGLTADELVERAEQALSRHDLATAEAVVRQLGTLDIAPDDPVLAARATILRAVLPVGDVNHEQTQALLEEAVELFAAAGDENRRQATLSRLGDHLCEHGRLEDGLALLRTAHAHLSTQPDVYQHVWSTVNLVNGLLAAEEQDLLTEDQRAEVRPLLTAAAAVAESGDPVLVGDVAARRMHLFISGEEQMTEAIAAARTALSSYREAEIPTRAAPAAFRLAVLLRGIGDAEAALAAVDEASALMPADAPTGLRVSTHGLRGVLLNELDREAESINDLRTAIAIGGSAELGQITYCRWDLALAYKVTGQLIDAADLAEEAIAGLETLGQDEEANSCRYLLAELHRAMREPDPALALYEEIAEFHRRRGDHEGESLALVESADLLDAEDRDALAAERYRQAGDAAALGTNAPRVAYCRYSAAFSLHWSGEADEAVAALDVAEQAVRDLAAADLDPNLVTWHRARLDHITARIFFSANRLEDAILRAAEAAAGYRALEIVDRAIQADLVHGRILMELDRPKEAEQLLADALTEVDEQSPMHELVSSALTAARERL